ncbi:AraC family transcriptional regulator [Cognatiyoonia sp. IB215182]|uniref:helix-turn-helix transcriptional regulator n=1 Tax=Cognatiyoonia sp. IB215182 TaxID=3097353 RepID=UPI002A0B16DF|nr:AraC family transcriptional regulator [Cognatiyoonia sp. IB215182]MDX8352468.1 AraC family transcriptional regulator [Cognatiyoonia sp. IB215182]
MTYIIQNSQLSEPAPRIPEMPQEIDLDGIRLILLPPGRCDVHLKLSVATFDVNLGTSPYEIAINSDRISQERFVAETLAFYPKGTDFWARVDNPLPGLVLEVSDDVLSGWGELDELSLSPQNHVTSYRPDAVAADLGRAGIHHLMRAAWSDTKADRLTAEGIALGLATRGLAQMTAKDGNITAEIDTWPRRSKRTEIDRAIDLLEARLCDPTLSIADLANASCLSSSRFSSVFKSMVGETPYRFILRRRAEHARDLIIGTRRPLAHIAFDAGFSNHAHMTVVMRRVFGVTPSAMRS